MTALAAGVPLTFDHLVVAAPNLAAGVAEFEHRTGTTSVPGGSHPGRGTANHLVPLVPRGWPAESLTYLEILGPDPAQDPQLSADAFADFTGLGAQRWAVHPVDLDATVAAAHAAGADCGSIFDMARTTPDGDRLEWRLTRRSPLALGGAQPFLIDWLDSPHPADTLRAESEAASPAAGVLTLERLEFFGPDPAELERALGLLAASGAAGPFTAEAAAGYGFRAVISGPRGDLELVTPGV